MAFFDWLDHAPRTSFIEERQLALEENWRNLRARHKILQAKIIEAMYVLRDMEQKLADIKTQEEQLEDQLRRIPKWR